VHAVGEVSKWASPFLMSHTWGPSCTPRMSAQLHTYHRDEAHYTDLGKLLFEPEETSSK
jgi:hypothetical protein